MVSCCSNLVARASVIQRLTTTRGHLENARVALVATHFDQIDQKSRQEKLAQLEFCRREIPAVNFSVIADLNALVANETHKKLWPTFKQWAAELTKYKTIPKFVQDLRIKLVERKLDAKWMTRKDLLAELQKSFSIGENDATFAVVMLRSMGDILEFEDQSIVLQPTWLSGLLSEVVKPARPPFNAWR